MTRRIKDLPGQSELMDILAGNQGDRADRLERENAELRQMLTKVVNYASGRHADSTGQECIVLRAALIEQARELLGHSHA